jgi:hypothetical protein
MQSMTGGNPGRDRKPAMITRPRVQQPNACLLGRSDLPRAAQLNQIRRGSMGKKAKSFEQYLVEYIGTSTVEQTQTALNFFTAIANAKINAGTPVAVKPAKTTKAKNAAAPAAASTTASLSTAA